MSQIEQTPQSASPISRKTAVVGGQEMAQTGRIATGQKFQLEKGIVSGCEHHGPCIFDGTFTAQSPIMYDSKRGMVSGIEDAHYEGTLAFSECHHPGKIGCTTKLSIVRGIVVTSPDPSNDKKDSPYALAA